MKPSGLGAAAYAALVVAIVSWGLSNVATRYLLARMHPIEIVTLRYSIASVLLVPVLLKGRTSRWPWADLGWMALFGFFGVVGFNLPVTWGTQSLPAGTVGLLITTEPVWISIISVAVLREQEPSPPEDVHREDGGPEEGRRHAAHRPEAQPRRHVRGGRELVRPLSPERRGPGARGA